MVTAPGAWDAEADKLVLMWMSWLDPATRRNVDRKRDQLESSIRTALRAAYAAGQREAREAAVAWLRHEADAMPLESHGDLVADALSYAADRIAALGEPTP